MKLTVRYNRRSIELDISSDATFGHLQLALHELCDVPPGKQRLLIAGGAAKRAGGMPSQDTLLREGGVADGTHLMLIGPRASTQAVVATTSGHKAPRATADMDSLVVLRKTTDTGVYSCSYSLGYVFQRVFVCKTCVASRNAAPQHLICAGCAAVCHAGHDVEHWGRRLNTRCDCCTVRMDVLDRHRVDPNTTDAPAATAGAKPASCQFIVDERTDEFPVLRLEENENTYPPAEGWCACNWETDSSAVKRSGDAAGSQSDHDVDDDGGCETCVMCGTGFWSQHVSRLDTSWLPHVGCYGTVRGEVVTFRCHTCNTQCCLPCRLHCHADHECGPPELFSTEDADGKVFSCGCSGMCDIAAGVGPEKAEAAAQRAVAFLVDGDMETADRPSGDGVVCSVMHAADVTSDEFLHFVCGRCVSRRPWLADPRRLRGCLSGAGLALLPEAAAAPHRCLQCDGDGAASHGLVLPANAFSELTCQCDACRQECAASVVGCAALDAPIDLFFSTARQCGQCRGDVAGQAFVCVTCELANSGLGTSYILCPSCHSSRDAQADAAHPSEHEFAEDSGDNLFRLFSASFASQLDGDSQMWVVNHWQEAQGMFFDYVRGAFGSRRLRDCDGTSSDGTGSLRSSRR